MTLAARKFWAPGGPDPLAVAPYAERAEWKVNWFDRALSAAAGTTASWARPRRLTDRRFVDRVVARIRALEAEPEEALARLTSDLRVALLRDGFRAGLLAEGFALVGLRAYRELGFEPRPVQIHGARLLLDGAMLEMATGEGKTLTAMLAAAVAGLAGVPVHVVTVNGYLAERDACGNEPVYRSLGLSSGFIVNGQHPSERAAIYARDIVHADNKELTFDYLRDRIAVGRRRSAARARIGRLLNAGPTRSGTEGLLLRGLHFCIVDEADSVLIDDARTPLIISEQRATPLDEVERLTVALQIAGQLREGADFDIRRDQRDLQLTAAGRRRVAALVRGMDGLWRVPRARDEMIRQALTAVAMFHRDRHYIVVDGAVQIVDEFTGRAMPDRSWEAGLHQLIEIKEGLPVSARNAPIARVTFQRFFRRYRRLSGMTGTGMEIAGEVWAEFDLRTVPVPTHRPVIRRDLGVTLARTSDARWDLVARRVRRLAVELGRPVLVGVRSVEASDELSQRLSALGVEHDVLNARLHEQEAEIVARAGRTGRVTVATNMAGRGTDIELDEAARSAGGLHVILTEYHESLRIDRQLIGRAGRQGDPGSFEAIVSIEDELFTRFAPWLTGPARLLRRIVGSRPTLALLRRVAQFRAEWAGRRIRVIQAKADRDQERRLAFSGQAE